MAAQRGSAHRNGRHIPRPLVVVRGPSQTLAAVHAPAPGKQDVCGEDQLRVAEGTLAPRKCQRSVCSTQTIFTTSALLTTHCFVRVVCDYVPGRAINNRLLLLLAPPSPAAATLTSASEPSAASHLLPQRIPCLPC